MDHTDVGLHAAIRALHDVVAPAVDPGQAQANDQLRLVIDYLAFVTERLEHLPQRRRFELTHHQAMARAVRSVLDDAQADALTRAIADADRLLAVPELAPGRMKAATAALAAAVCEVVRNADALDPARRQAVERCVLQSSLERIAFERSWYLPLGLDPDPHDVRPLADFGSAG